MNQNVNCGIALTLVFVLKSPEFLPINPFELIDKGLFTKDEVKTGSMDFGPGYALHSNKGYTLLREVQRVQVAFDADKTNDQSFISRVTNAIVEVLKIKATALGVNFSIKVNGQLVELFKEVETRIADTYFDGKRYVPGYSFECAGDGFRSKFSVAVSSITDQNIGVAMSVNNHFEFKEQNSIKDAVDRIPELKNVFAEFKKGVVV